MEGRGPASGEKRKLDLQAISILTLISPHPLASHAMFCTGSYGAVGRCQVSAGGGYIQRDPGRGCRQGRREERQAGTADI